MDRSIPLLIIGLVFGGGIGFTLAAANGITLDGHDHNENVASAHHDHGSTLSIAAGDDAPTLAVEAKADPMSGWNLHIATKNFRFSPEHASGDPVDGEGHAHVYINGNKLGRFYGPWVHLDNLPEGKVTVKVTLNGNDHRPLAVASVPLEKTISISN